MLVVIKYAWGRESDNYIGKSLIVFCNDDVKWAGKAVGGIQISHMSDTVGFTIKLTLSRTVKKDFTVKPVNIEPAKPVETADPELIKKGNEASEGGVESYIKWKDSLNDEHKEQIRPHHKEWARNARAVSEKMSETVDEDGVVTEEPSDDTFPGDIPMPEGEIK